MIRIQLPDAEAQRLEQAFRQATDRKLRDRLQIVRLAHRGRTHQDIAADLGITPRTVQRWLNAYLDAASTACDHARPRGHAPAIPAELADEVRRWVIEGPTRQGLDRANWTHAELADHLYKTHGISASRSAMQRFCRKMGIRLYRPTYRFLRGDPDKQAEAREDLAELREKAEAGELVLLSQDEARFPMVPTLGDAGRQGAPADRRHAGLQGPAVRLRRGQPAHRRRARQHAGEPARAKKTTGQSKTRRLQEAFADHLRHVGRVYPAEQAQAGGADDRQRPVAPGQADRRGPGGQPAPGVQAAAQLQPAAERDRAVLEDAAAAGDAQPTVRHPGGPEAVAPGQPVLLPDGAGPGPAPGRQVLHPPRKPDSISGRVNEDRNGWLGLNSFRSAMRPMGLTGLLPAWRWKYRDHPR